MYDHTQYGPSRLRGDARRAIYEKIWFIHDYMCSLYIEEHEHVGSLHDHTTQQVDEPQASEGQTEDKQNLQRVYEQVEDETSKKPKGQNVNEASQNKTPTNDPTRKRTSWRSNL